MNRHNLLVHRQQVYLDALYVLMDKVENKRNPNYIEDAIDRVKYRGSKLKEARR